MLNNLLKLEGVAVLSKEQQKSVNGGYSKLYCAYHSTNIVIKVEGGQDIVIHRAHFTYEECRALKD
jgi:hypothetical protein